MGFRDEAEAARARIASLERSLEETQQALDAARAELGVEAASLARVSPDQAWHDAEIKRLRTRLASAGAERQRLLLALLGWRVGAALFFVVLVLGIGVLGSELRDRRDELLRAVCHRETRAVCE